MKKTAATLCFVLALTFCVSELYAQRGAGDGMRAVQQRITGAQLNQFERPAPIVVPVEAEPVAPVVVSPAPRRAIPIIWRLQIFR